MTEKTFPVKGEAYTFRVWLRDYDNTRLAKSAPTLAAGDVKVGIDATALANLGTLPVATGKLVLVTLTAAEMNGDEISVVFSDVAGAEWADLAIIIHPVSTVTAAAVALPATVEAGTITLSRGDTLSAALTDLGSLADYSNIYFTVKDHPGDTDAESIIQIKINTGGVGDGLTYFQAAAGTLASGSITIDDAVDGDITVMLKAAESALLEVKEYTYDVQIVRSVGTPVGTLTTGAFVVNADYTRITT